MGLAGLPAPPSGRTCLCPLSRIGPASLGGTPLQVLPVTSRRQAAVGVSLPYGGENRGYCPAGAPLRPSPRKELVSLQSAHACMWTRSSNLCRRNAKRGGVGPGRTKRWPKVTWLGKCDNRSEWVVCPRGSMWDRVCGHRRMRVYVPVGRARWGLRAGCVLSSLPELLP